MDNFDLSRLASGTRHTAWIEVAPRADGGKWRLPIMVIVGAATGPTLLVLAGIHGDEYTGIEAIPHIFEAVEPVALRGRLVMIPVCNMPAYEAATRANPLDGLNMARVFPGEPNGKLTERIAYHISSRFIAQADFLIDLHTAGTHYEIQMLVGYFHDSSDLGQRSLEAAMVFGAPVLWGHPAPIPPGRTISAAFARGIPWLYTESPENHSQRAAHVVIYRDGVLNVMKHLNMVDCKTPSTTITHRLVGDGNLDQVITSPATGYFFPDLVLFAAVQA